MSSAVEPRVVTDDVAAPGVAGLPGARGTAGASASLVPGDASDARAVMAQHARSFTLAARLLPAASRDDAARIYTFCRYVDDLADEAPDPDVARRDLSLVREALAGNARPDRPTAAWLEVADRRGIPTHAALDLVDGILSDLDPVCVADDAELVRYGYHVAGTVGLMMCGVLGVRDPHAWRHAIDLGVAMQITNICRDVKEDAARGRVYLPSTRLEAAGTSARELLEGGAPAPAVAQVVRELLELADRYYRSADDGMSAIPLRSRAAIVVASRVYRAIGVRLLRRHGGDPLHGRTVVPTPARLAWLLAGLGALTRPRMWRPAPGYRHDAALHAPLARLLGDDTRVTALLPQP